MLQLELRDLCSGCRSFGVGLHTTRIGQGAV